MYTSSMPLRGIALALPLAAALTGCGTYMKVMGSLPMAGSAHAVNTMAVPVCKVTLYSTSDPGSTYDNERNGNVLLEPGAEGTLSYPIAKDEKGGPKEDSKYGMRIFGCQKDAFSMKPGRQLADTKEIDVHQQLVLR